MILMVLLFSALAAAGSPKGEGAGGSGFWILSCEMPTPAATDAVRTFRLGPKSFQERKPGQKAFGSNLCNSFPCAADERRIQGTISSASLILTITLDPQTGSATWGTAGASGLSRKSGACSVHPEPLAPAH
jgi:hypothetical protein